MRKSTSKLLAVTLSALFVMLMIPTVAMAADIPFGIELKTRVVQGGDAVPGNQTFTYELNDVDTKGVKSSADYGVNLTNPKVTTSGVGDFMGTISGTIDTSKVTEENGWRKYSKTSDELHYSFELKEQDSGAAGWTYDTRHYGASFWCNPKTGEAGLEVHDYGNDVYHSPEYRIFTNTYNGYSMIDFSFGLTKKVEQGGEVAPGRETFSFILNDVVTQGTKKPADYGINITKNKVTTNGVGSYPVTVSGTIDPAKVTEENGWVKYSKNSDTLHYSFELKEQDGGADGWTYDTDHYGASFWCDPKTGEAGVEIHAYGNDVYYTPEYTIFTNTFTKAEEVKKPELNKEDHFAFLQGYEGGTFGPDQNMTRAEVTTMFARLLTEQMEPGKIYTSTFKDIHVGAWHSNYVGYMQRFGIINGYEDGTFRPDAPITRAEFAAIASRFEKLTEGNSVFTDVPANHWAVRYINFAATRGWVNGYSDGSFRPDNFITRAEVTAVTCRLLERNVDEDYVAKNYSKLPHIFSDVNRTYWAFPYVIEAANGHDYTKADGVETWAATYK